MVDWEHPEISLRRQCELLGVNRSGLYFQARGESAENLKLMRLIDMLEEDDDVQTVTHNFDMSDEVAAQLE